MAAVGMLAAVAVLATGVLAGCKSGHDTAAAGAAATQSAASSTPASTSPAAIPAAAIAFTPAGESQNVNPVAPVTVKAASGQLTAVSLTNAAGAAVAGQLSPDHTSWTATEVLGYDKDYTFTAKAVNATGQETSQTASFSTLKPKNMTQPYINTVGGSSLTDGGTFGVGMVVAVHFDEKVDRAKAEKTLQVTTTPAVAGAWYWLDDQNAHWRPQNYYASGTKVTVAAKVYGVEVGNGLYGQSDVSKSFTIGAKHVAIADDKTHQVQVFFNDQLVRIMPTSMGRGGSVNVNGNTISFWTQRGTYTVLDKANPVLMDSSTYGLPVNSKLGYKENIYWATRISTDGVYLHQLDSTVWAQGNTDTSHGCLNLNEANAQWYYQNAQVGDVVQVLNTGGDPLEVWQGGDWSLSWDKWTAGSAVH